MRQQQQTPTHHYTYSRDQYSLRAAEKHTVKAIHTPDYNKM